MTSTDTNENDKLVFKKKLKTKTVLRGGDPKKVKIMEKILKNNLFHLIKGVIL